MRLRGVVLALSVCGVGVAGCGPAIPARSAAEIAAEQSFLLGPATTAVGAVLPSTATGTPGSGPSASASATGAPTSFHLLDAIGDAYTSGAYEGGRGAYGWPALVAAHLGARVITRGVPGTGYLVAGASTTFGQRVADVVSDRPDLVIVWGARVDVGEPPAELETAVDSTLQQLVSGLPGATIVAIGPAWVDSNPPADFVAARDAEAAGANAAGALFFDPLAQNWFGQIGAMSGDGVHPTNAGFASAATFIEADLVAAGRP